MKRTRILMLGLGFAILAGIASAEPAVAQCWDCIPGPGPISDPGRRCVFCEADDWGLGALECTTPECTRCTLGGGFCKVLGGVMLDGRVSPPEPLESPATKWSAGASGALVLAIDGGATGTPEWPETRRSCDGGIISTPYSADEVSAVRTATAQLRL